MRFASLLLLPVGVYAAVPTQLLPKTPVRFEQNRGQIPDRAIEWIARGPAYAFAFTKDAALMQWRERRIAMRLEGADAAAAFAPESPFSVPTNYLTTRFQGTVQSYTRLRRHRVYPGIDLVYYGNGERLEYDFEVAPGADPSRIRMRFSGADHIALNSNGDLVLKLGDGSVVQHRPGVYQTDAAGSRIAVAAKYRLRGDRVTIDLGRYDRSAPLIIDPVITFAAYVNGSGPDVAVALVRDAQGFVYIAGNTSSADFSTSANAFFGANRGSQDIFVMKINPRATDGSQVIVYSTLYGGTAADSARALAVGPDGLIYVAGTTASTDLLTTSGAYQTTNGGGNDAFVAVFNPFQSGTPSLAYGSYIGGNGFDEASSVATFNGRIYLTGSTASNNFPLAHPFWSSLWGPRDAFIAEIDPTQAGSAGLVASTYFAGSGVDYGRAITVDANGFVYVAGLSYSPDIPMTANANQPSAAGAGDAFLVVLQLETPVVIYDTYLGGSGVDEVKKILVDPSGLVALTGYTQSSDFPVTANAAQPGLGAPGAANAFLTLLNVNAPPGQAIVYSTYFGGNTAEVAYDLKRDASGRYYISGYSMSRNMPVTANALSPVSANGGLDGFVAVINPSAAGASGLVYSTFITGPGSQAVYGVDVDSSGQLYLTGYATSDIFPPGFEPHSVPGDADVFLLNFVP